MMSLPLNHQSQNLYSCKYLCKLEKGRLWYDDWITQGNSFIYEIRIKIPDEKLGFQCETD